MGSTASPSPPCHPSKLLVLIFPAIACEVQHSPPPGNPPPLLWYSTVSSELTSLSVTSRCICLPPKWNYRQSGSNTLSYIHFSHLRWHILVGRVCAKWTPIEWVNEWIRGILAPSPQVIVVMNVNCMDNNYVLYLIEVWSSWMKFPLMYFIVKNISHLPWAVVLNIWVVQFLFYE